MVFSLPAQSLPSTTSTLTLPSTPIPVPSLNRSEGFRWPAMPRAMSCECRCAALLVSSRHTPSHWLGRATGPARRCADWLPAVLAVARLEGIMGCQLCVSGAPFFAGPLIDCKHHDAHTSTGSRGGRRRGTDSEVCCHHHDGVVTPRGATGRVCSAVVTCRLVTSRLFDGSGSQELRFGRFCRRLRVNHVRATSL